MGVAGWDDAGLAMAMAGEAVADLTSTGDGILVKAGETVDRGLAADMGALGI